MKASIKPFARAYKSRSFKLHGAPSLSLDEEDKNISFDFSISESRSANGLSTSDRRIQELHEEAESVFRRAFSTSETSNPESDTAFNAHGSGRVLPCLLEGAGYEAAGACAIQLEDQQFPKKCGHMLGRKVVSAEEMAAKIRVAVESRSDPNFLIIARTDARTTLGLDEAMRRAEVYARAGADLLFIESPESEEEMRTLGRSFDLPLVANMVDGGRTPVLTAAALTELGYSLAIFPASAFLATGAAVRSVYQKLKADGSTAGMTQPLYPFPEFSQMMGFDWVASFDKAHADSEG